MTKPISFENKTIAVHQLHKAMHCLFAATATESRIRDGERSAGPSRSRYTVLGHAAHKFLAGMDPQQILELVREAVPTMCDEDLAELIVKARKVAERMKQRRADNSRDLRVEKTISWKDPQTGWTVFLQPDRMESCRDALGDYIQITEIKYPKVVRNRHIETVRLFGLFTYMLLHQGGAKNIRIKLVVECLEQENSHVEWMNSEQDVMKLLGQVREALLSLESAHEQTERVATRTVGEHCFGCALRDNCRQGGKFITRTTTAIRAANENRRGRHHYIGDTNRHSQPARKHQAA